MCDFSPVCVFKCNLKWPVLEDTYSHWLHFFGFLNWPVFITERVLVLTSHSLKSIFLLLIHHKKEKRIDTSTCAPQMSPGYWFLQFWLLLNLNGNKQKKWKWIQNCLKLLFSLSSLLMNSLSYVPTNMYSFVGSGKKLGICVPLASSTQPSHAPKRVKDAPIDLKLELLNILLTNLLRLFRKFCCHKSHQVHILWEWTFCPPLRDAISK